MDASVVGAVVTSGVAVVVAVAGGVSTQLRAASDRRYERRRASLIDTQDAALALRDALRGYGSSLRARTAEPGPGGDGFVMSVAAPLDAAVAVAEGRLAVTRSRVDDQRVVQAVLRWQAVARASLIDPRDTPAAEEQRAFDGLNDVIGEALQSADGVSPAER